MGVVANGKDNGEGMKNLKIMETTIRQWSRYQEGIFDFVLNGEGNLLISSAPGSGKTTTIKECARLAREKWPKKRIIFFAFNKDIVKVIKEALGEEAAQTVNSLGARIVWSHLRSQKVKFKPISNTKYSWIVKKACENLLGMQFKEGSEAFKAWTTHKAILSLISFTMSSLVDENDDVALTELIIHYGIELPIDLPEAFQVLRHALKEGEAQARAGYISFDEQIWLPHRWGLQSKFQYDLVFVDEAQDFSKAKTALVQRVCAPGGRMVFVGDEFQSIYGFAGADAASMDNIKEAVNAHILPLSICYRCPRKIVELAQQINPDVEAAPDAIEGEVRNISYQEFLAEITPEDRVISRCNADTFRATLKLLSNRKHARMVDRDLEKDLSKIINESLGDRPFDMFLQCLSDYEAEQKALFISRRQYSQAETVSDKAECLRLCLESFQPKTKDALLIAITSIFEGEENPILLSSVHKYKGQENNRIFIVAPNRLPLVWNGQQPWEATQERNILFVALTRAQKELVFVADPKDK